MAAAFLVLKGLFGEAAVVVLVKDGFVEVFVRFVVVGVLVRHVQFGSDAFEVGITPDESRNCKSRDALRLEDEKTAC